MKINLHKPNISIQIENGIDLKHQSTPISKRNKNESRHISRFTSSLEYIAKLHTLSNNKIFNQTPPPEKVQSKGFISPNHTIKIKTGANSPSKLQEVIKKTGANSLSKLLEVPLSLETTVITFLDSMTNLQEAISKKEPNVQSLKKEFEMNKKQLFSMALSSLSKNKPIKIKAHRDQTHNEAHLIEEISSIKNKQKQKQKQTNSNSYSTCNINVNLLNKMKHSSTQTEGNLFQNCFEIVKEIYSLMKEKERNYSIDFNYETNNSLYFNKNYMNDAQLLENCNLIRKELIIIINKLSDNFDKIKSNLNATISSLKEENKKSRMQLNEFQKVINEYLKQFHDLNSSLYSPEDLIKIFKKNYSKVLNDMNSKENKKNEFEKDLKLYKTMSDTYKQALEDSQIKLKAFEKEIEELRLKLGNQMESETIINASNEELLLNQINLLKNELKEIKEGEQNISSNEFFSSISNALTKLVLEINITAKSKDYLYVIFKLIGLSDEKINDIYMMKEKKKKYLTLFKSS